MITDQLPLCERCGQGTGRPYQVHWGTLERRPVRDDQESGGYVVLQNGYRIDGTLTVSLCDDCAYWTFDIGQTLARGRVLIALILLASPIWLALGASVFPFWLLVILFHVLVVTLVALQIAYRRGLLPRRRPMSPGYHAGDLARSPGR